MTRRRALAAVALAAALVVGCGRPGPRDAGTAGDDAAPRAASPSPSPGAAPAPLAEAEVTVYFPAAESEGLQGVPRKIFDAREPADRAKQVLSELIAGPQGADGVLPSLPAGTAVRQVYLAKDGVAWVDLSDAFRQALGSGIESETLAVWSIVDSLVFNVPEIARVGLLVEGHAIESGAHLDLTRPIRSDRALIVRGGPPAASPATAPGPSPSERAGEGMAPPPVDR